jgi:hypothetical protein
MKKVIVVSTGGIASLLICLFLINQLVTRGIRTEIEVNAPIEQVWNAIMDHESYPEWNPFIKSISGSTDVGDGLEVTIQSEGNEPMEFEPLVLVNDHEHEFRWVGKLGVTGVFDGEHYFVLEEIGPTQTRFIQGENFTGLLSGLFMQIIGEDTKSGFVAMNKALKTLLEKN